MYNWVGAKECWNHFQFLFSIIWDSKSLVIIHLLIIFSMMEQIIYISYFQGEGEGILRYKCFFPSDLINFALH